MAVDGYPIGTSPEVTAEFHVNGVLTDPTTVTTTVESPSGVESNPTTSKVSVGIYVTSFELSEPGLWGYRIVGDAPAIGVTEGRILCAASPVLDAFPAPPYTYDLTTDIGRVRLYIDDRDLSHVSSSVPREQRSAIFDDDEIAEFLAMEGRVYRAAAVALTTIANNRSLLVQRRDLDGATVDFGSLRSDLLKSAEAFIALDDQTAGGDMAPADGIAEVNWDVFAEKRIVVNALLRENL